MKGIFSIEFKKTRSPKYQGAINIMMGLPNYSFTEDCHSIRIDNIKDFIRHQKSIDYLLDIILGWKTCSVYLYEEKLTNNYYRNRLENKVGKYWEYFNWNSSIGYEELPLPFVHYPEQNIGAFIGFSDDIDTDIYFCECQREAIENYVKLRTLDSDIRYVGERAYPLGSEAFPLKISEASQNWADSPIQHLRFREKLCFKCNSIVPHRNFTEVGSEFMKKFGWYVMEEFYKLGIDLLRHVVIPDYSDDELYCSMRDTFVQFKEHSEKIRQVTQLDIPYEDKAELIKGIPTPASPDYRKMVENTVRERLGFKKIGDGWVSETMLFNIVSNIFKNEDILRHYRPTWLDRLELDIYIPNLKLGFEYQGIQHHMPVAHWGGMEQFKVVQEHDNRKKQLCHKNNVLLICIDCDEPLTEVHVRDRIKEVYKPDERD